MPNGKPAYRKPCARCGTRKRHLGYSYCGPCRVEMHAMYEDRRKKRAAAAVGPSVYAPAPPRKRCPDTDDTRIRHECDVCHAHLYDESTRCSYCAGLTREAAGSTLHAEAAAPRGRS